ncbi:hypothetical protein J2R99_003485 [Rhodopseudomonas julia]|uniref:Tlde1 domain-containing protein n=1 Tax=Rhodopseudomonas julia TaxID=200617 RepID=A0ABU0CAS9_9BRAD|nr:DUF2778 domain-containing protein [Rhodopseudomonas julia]MDQ0327616.1 hypothetical protein [Rhodopseudomonas julia]
MHRKLQKRKLTARKRVTRRGLWTVPAVAIGAVALLATTTFVTERFVQASASLIAAGGPFSGPMHGGAEGLGAASRGDRLSSVAFKQDQSSDLGQRSPTFERNLFEDADVKGLPPALFDTQRFAWQPTMVHLPEIVEGYPGLLVPAREAGTARSATAFAMVPQTSAEVFAKRWMSEAFEPTAGAYLAALIGIDQVPLPEEMVSDAVAGLDFVPVPRPDIGETEVASLEPDARPASAVGFDEALDAQAVLKKVAVPASRPTPSVIARGGRSPASLAYAAVEDSAASDSSDGFFNKLFVPGSRARLPGRDSGVAVYEIESATVYLPNGERLEAHSGLAKMQDDPRYVREKNRGPTPPNVYDLVMRESRFHGAEAIRLLPSDGRKKYNRDGLLAHPYMYAGGGSRSQSNGCVVFANYERFLKAFKKGHITRMIVVPRLKDLNTYMAAL